MPIHIILAR